VPAISYAVVHLPAPFSAGAFAQARAFHFQLHQASQTCEIADVYADALEDARRRIRLLYRLDSAGRHRFRPSGTDLEYSGSSQPRSAAAARCNIIVEVDESAAAASTPSRGAISPRTPRSA
jgi:hypothetical protein